VTFEGYISSRYISEIPTFYQRCYRLPRVCHVFLDTQYGGGQR